MLLYTQHIRMQIHLLLLFAILPSISYSSKYYVIPYNYYPSRTNEFTLQHYLNHTSKYFTSNTQFCFQPGDHYLPTDIIVKDVTDFMLVGIGHCTITCASNVSIVVINATDFKLQNITFKNCGKDQSLHINLQSSMAANEHSKTANYNASILLFQCNSVKVNNVTVILNSGFVVALLLYNQQQFLEIDGMNVMVNHSQCLTSCGFNKASVGIFIYYDDNDGHSDNPIQNLLINNFKYENYKVCEFHQEYALYLLLLQKYYNVSITIVNTIFCNLANTSALYYYGETCGIDARNVLIIRNSLVSNNTGNSKLKMFHIVLYNLRCFDNVVLLQYCKQQYSNIYFINCTFTYNINMEAMIYIVPASSRAITGYIRIANSTFCNNRQFAFYSSKE